MAALAPHRGVELVLIGGGEARLPRVRELHGRIEHHGLRPSVEDPLDLVAPEGDEVTLAYVKVRGILLRAGPGRR